MLLFKIKLRKQTHSAWFLFSIWPILSFWGGFQVFVAAFYRRKSRLNTERPGPRNANPLLDFSLQRKEGYSICPLFPSARKNLRTFCSNSNDFCFTTGAFNFPTQLVTFQQTTTQLEINISDRSCVTNATYQTGAQSKMSIKIQPLSPDCAPVS